MYDLPMAMIMSTRAVARQFDYQDGAEPGRPAAPRTARAPRALRIRLAVAGALDGAARAIAPKECAPAR